MTARISWSKVRGQDPKKSVASGIFSGNWPSGPRRPLRRFDGDRAFVPPSPCTRLAAFPSPRAQWPSRASSLNTENAHYCGVALSLLYFFRARAGLLFSVALAATAPQYARRHCMQFLLRREFFSRGPMLLKKKEKRTENKGRGQGRRGRGLTSFRT